MSILVFLFLISILFYIDLTTYYRLNDIISRLKEIFVVLIFVSISFLINIGKEMSLLGFRILGLHTFP